MSKEVRASLRQPDAEGKRGIDPIRLRIFDWGGNNATGDDLLAWATRESMERAATGLGAQIAFHRWWRYQASVCGGGTIFGHGVFFKRIARRIRFDRKPYIVFGSGARKPDRDLNPAERDVLRRFCAGAQQIGVRGPATKEWLESYSIPVVEVVGDAALAFEAVEVPDMPGDFKVGVNLRHMGGGLRGEEQHSSNRRNVALFARLCDEIVRQYGATLYFFDFCRNRFDSDQKAIRDVLAGMTKKDTAATSRIVPFEENRNPVEAFSRLGRMDFVLSQRMHPSLMAWVQGVPSVGIEYQFGKTYDAFGPLGLESFVLSIADMTVDQYMDRMALVLEQERGLVDQCRAKVQDLRSRQDEFLQRFLLTVV